MNKKLLAAAVGATLAATTMSANAGVKVFGSAQFEIGMSTFTSETEDNVGNPVSDTSAFQSSLQDKQRGRWGIKASEDIGNGMKGLAHIEYDTEGDGDDNGTGCGGLGCGGGERQIWAGIKGKFGMISGGSHHGIYKTFGGVKWDPLTATFLEARNSNAMSGGRYGHNNFLDRSLRYMSPKLGPVVIGLVRQFDYADTKDNTDGIPAEDETTGRAGNNHSWQAGAKAKFGLAEVIAVYGLQAKEKNVSGTGVESAGEDSARFKLGARFSFAKMHKVAVQYEIISDRQGADQAESHTYVNWIGKFGKISPQVGIGIYAALREDLQDTSDFTTGGTFFQAAVTWRPSKTFRVFGGLRQQATVTQETDRASEVDLDETTTTELTYSVGIRKDF